MTANDPQEEAIPESLKNILLLMANGGYLVAPSQDQSKEEIWTQTQKRLERFLPDLFREIFPDASKQPAPVAAPSSASPTNDLTVENPNEQSNDTAGETASSPNPAAGTGDGDDGTEHAQPEAS